MPLLFLIVFFFALLCFLIIPGIGALATRAKWRKFRERVKRIKQSPIFEIGSERSTQFSLTQGIITATQGQKTIWLTIYNRSIKIDASQFEIVFMQDEGQDLETNYNTSPPLIQNWKSSGPVMIGSRVLVYASLYEEFGEIKIVYSDENKGMLVFYEGDEGSSLTRLLYSSRQINEYWNPITPLSLILGFFLIALCATILLRSEPNKYWAVISLSIGVMPFSILLPPGILGFYLYRSLWRKGRQLRAFRDLVSMLEAYETFDAEQSSLFNLVSKTQAKSVYSSNHPFFKLQMALEDNPHKIGRGLQNKARSFEAAGIAILFTSIVINSFLLFLVLVQIAKTI